MAKANEFARMFNIYDFEANVSWWSRLKKREGIIDPEPKTVEFEESQSPDVWLENDWLQLQQQFAPEDIYNACEFGLFFRALPDGSYTFMNDFAKGPKRNKEKISVLATSSMTGDKIRLVVVGKSKRLNNMALPVDYVAHRNAKLTSNWFSKWLKEWDSQLMGREILVLVDSSTGNFDIN